MSGPATGLPTGTVTFLFTDVEGSTRLVQTLGEQYGDALEQHRFLLRGAFTAHGGQELDTQGDSFLVVFGSAQDAVAAADAGQRALRAATWPGGGTLRVRMGLHTGEPRLREGSYVGLDVHRGARICGAAHGGQVLLSQVTAGLAGAEPLPGATVRDLGAHLLKDLPAPERLFQLQGHGLPGDFPPPRALNTTNLPVQVNRLVGRRAEIARLRELLAGDGARLVTCTGSGGTGKTRLALHVGAELATEFADGVVLVALGAVRDPDLVPAALAATLGLREGDGRDGRRALAEHLRTRELLLILDNFEHVTAAAPLVADLLAAAAGLKVLVTSRTALRIAGEHELDLPPLSLPAEGGRGVASSEAVELLLERAEAVGGALDLETVDAAILGEICSRLDGLPLAIELAAARLKVLSPDELLARLSSRLGVLTGGRRDAPARQRTLRRTLDWSFDLLPAAERTLFEQLAVFVGGATLEAIEAVCHDGDAVEEVAALVDHSLLRRSEHEEENGARFHMLETVREYALERLEQRDDAGHVRRRYADHFLAMAEAAEPELSGEEQAEWLRRLEADHANLRAALDWLLESGEATRALRLLSATLRFWRAHGHVAEARLRLARGLASTNVAGPARAEALWAAGRLALAQGDLDPARRSYEEALALFRSLGSQREEVFTLSELAVLARETGRLDEAERTCGQAVELARELGDDRALSGALNVLAGIASEGGEHMAARRLHAEALDLRRGLGDPLLILNTVFNLGMAELAAGAYEQSAASLEDCLALARRLGDVIHAAAALCALGELSLLDGREPGVARAYLRESAEYYVELENTGGLAECLHALAGVAAAEGRAAAAARLWGAVERFRDESDGAPLPAELEIAVRFVPVALAELGEERFEQARAAGRGLELEAALAEARADAPTDVPSAS